MSAHYKHPPCKIVDCESDSLPLQSGVLGGGGGGGELGSLEEKLPPHDETLLKHTSVSS